MLGVLKQRHFHLVTPGVSDFKELLIGTVSSALYRSTLKVRIYFYLNKITATLFHRQTTQSMNSDKTESTPPKAQYTIHIILLINERKKKIFLLTVYG